MEITAVVLIGLVLAGLSLLIDYAPEVAPWFERLALAQKRRLIWVACVVLVAGITGLDCAGLVATSIDCSPLNWGSLATLIYNTLFAVGGMTAFHLGTKPSK